MARRNIMPGSSIESEKTLERKLSREVKNRGGWCLKLLSQHISGLPDRLCLFPGGRLFFAEIKTTRQKPRKIQVHVCNKIRALGFRVEIIDNSMQMQQILNDYD